MKFKDLKVGDLFHFQWADSTMKFKDLKVGDVFQWADPAKGDSWHEKNDAQHAAVLSDFETQIPLNIVVVDLDADCRCSTEV